MSGNTCKPWHFLGFKVFPFFISSFTQIRWLQNYHVLIIKYDSFCFTVLLDKCFHCYVLIFLLCECDYCLCYTVR